MEFFKTSNLYSLNKYTYVNLRWIAYFGQIIAILIVQFILKYTFNYFACISSLGVFTSLFILISDLHPDAKIIHINALNFKICFILKGFFKKIYINIFNYKKKCFEH